MVDPFAQVDLASLAGELKKNYRRLSLKFHPDKQKGKSAAEQAA